jgi:hypothetical protein
MYGDKQDILDLFSGPNQNFLILNILQDYPQQNDLIDFKALALEASNIILNYFDFFFFRPNLSLCLNLKTTIAPAINKIATAS